MIEELKELAAGDMLSIDDKNVRELTSNEDFDVLGIKVYSQDEGEIMFIDLNGFHLVAHTFNGDPRFYVYELNADGDEEALENEGFRLVMRDEQLPKKVYAGRNALEVAYKSVIGPVCGLNVERNDRPPEDDPSEIAVCEYRHSKNKPLTHVLIEMLDTTFNLYQGFQIKGSSILL